MAWTPNQPGGSLGRDAPLPEDLDWRQRFRNRDPAAWSAAIEALSPSLVRLIATLLPPKHDREGVQSETWERAYERVERYDASRAIGPWVIAICVRLCRNHRRHLGRFLRHLRLLRREPEGRPDPPVSEAMALLQLAMDALPEGERQVIALRFSGGLSYVEVAEVLRISDQTARKRLSRGLVLLRAGPFAQQLADLLDGAHGRGSRGQA
ncbi:MAG: RNA polymerase sigma factor [Planctomycetia bacterium]